HGVEWLAVVVERGGDLGDDDGGAEGDELGFDGDLGEVFDGPDAAGDPAAVADGDDRLVAERGGDEDAVDGVLEHAGDRVVVLGRDDQIGVGFFDLVVPASDERVRVRGVVEVADRA